MNQQNDEEKLLEFLQQEKLRTQERIRQCQIFLNATRLADVFNYSDLRESLESVRNNAEDDYGQFLHLITVINKTVNPNTTDPTSPVRNLPIHNVIENIGPYQNQPNLDGRFNSSSVDASRDGDLDENFDPLGREEDLLGYEGLAQEQEDQPIIVAETEEERREEEDFVPGQLSAAPMVTTKGRFITTNRATLNVNNNQQMARSLPMKIPLPDEPGFVPDFPPEMEQTDLDSINIHDSIQQIAKSLHTNALGELPKPQSLFGRKE